MIGNFTYCNPTKLYFGDKSLENLNAELAKYGKNVILIYGKESIKKNGIYDEITEILKACGKSVAEIAGVMPNPTLDKLYEGIETAKAHKADLLLAVGGGSVCDYAKPTLSRQIKDLEDELGHKLFTRGNHSMALTAEGMILRKRAEEIVSMVDRTEAEFCSMDGEVAGDIYIGGGETDAVNLIAKVAKELRDDYPNIRYHLYSGNAEDVTERLDKGLLDFGILVQPADISKYDYLNIPAKDVWGVVMKKDCPLAEKETVCKADLLNVPLIPNS